MSRRHRPSRADRQPVTRRYIRRVVERARQDILDAIVMSDRLAKMDEPNIEPVSEDRWRSLFPKAGGRTDA